jgi:hypothetical protein
MAIIEWNGTTGVMSTAANWVGGVAPGAADTAVFTRGSQSVTSGFIAALTSQIIEPGYGGSIGGSGAPQTTSITGTAIHRGRAEWWLQDAAGTTGDVYIAAMNNAVVVHLGGDLITRIVALRGNVTLDADLGALTLLETGFVVNPLSDLTLATTAGGGTITLWNCMGGNCSLAQTATTIVQGGGVIELPVTEAAATATNIYQLAGSFRHLAPTNVTRLHASGSFDFGANAKTITTSMFGPRARLLGYNPAIQTFTNAPIDLRNVGEAA